ncbi:hypothetical protein ABTH07_16060, partial [Acinetobacter baumannii]
MTIKLNPLNAIDFYKADHRRQYPAGTEYVYANFTPRSSRLAKMLPDFDDIVKLLYYSYKIRKKLEITHRLSRST